MSDRLVTLGSFQNTYEANVVRSALDAVGIPAYVADEEVAGMAWMLTNAIGGVKVLVREEDVERAIAIIADLHDADDFPEEVPDHDSDDVNPENECPSSANDLNSREESADRAFRSAVLRLVLIPLQLYATWLLILVFLATMPIRPDIRHRLWFATAINAIVMFVAVSVLWIVVEQRINARPLPKMLALPVTLEQEITVPLIITP